MDTLEVLKLEVLLPLHIGKSIADNKIYSREQKLHEGFCAIDKRPIFLTPLITGAEIVID